MIYIYQLFKSFEILFKCWKFIYNCKSGVHIQTSGVYSFLWPVSEKNIFLFSNFINVCIFTAKKMTGMKLGLKLSENSFSLISSGIKIENDPKKKNREEG